MGDAIRIALWNANGLIQRRNELEIFLHTEKIDIILVSETHFTNKSYFSIPNYKCYSTQYPDDTAHGGTAMLITKSILHHELEKYEKSFIQATSNNITSNNGSKDSSSVLFYIILFNIFSNDSAVHYHISKSTIFSYLRPRRIFIKNLFIFCPPRHSISKEQFSSFFETLGPKFLAGGNFNAKHTNWGSRLITPKWRSFFNSII